MGVELVQTGSSRVASIRMLAASDAAGHRVRDLPGPAVYSAAALSILLHAWLVLLLYRLDARLEELRVLPPKSEPIVMLEPVHDREIVREAPTEIDALGAASIAARLEPPRFELTDTSRPVLDHAPATATDPSGRSAASPPESTIAVAEALASASFADGQQPTLAPPLEDAVPARSKVAIDPRQQAMLVQRVIDVARTLQDGRQAEFAWQQDGQPYRAVLTRRSGLDSMDFESVLVDITTKGHNGTSMQTQLTLKRLAFSQFTQFIDRWDRNVQMHDDEIIGRFHSNSAFQVLHDDKAAPVISGLATTAAVDIDVAPSASRRNRAEEMFQGGLEVSARRIALPSEARPFIADTLDPQANVHRFWVPTHLTFHADGRFTWKTRRTKAQGRYAHDRPEYFIAATPGATLSVKGVVNGRVLVYAPERIVIEGDLRYADDPRVSPRADDYLGLVSDSFVEVARPYVTGPGDLHIDAAIFARRGFLIADFDSATSGGTLSIYGSLTSGTMSASEPRYATKIEFDSRLDRVRPPGFPAANRYELASWEAEWRGSPPDASEPDSGLPALDRT